MANKGLVIDVAPKSVPNGSTNQWSALTNAGVFIGDILTPPLSEEANIGTLVSGIPTAFARVDLFLNAIKNGHEESRGDLRNLNTYYVELLKEWKGLLAALALDYASFEVRHIELAYSDGRNADTTVNIYEPKGAFGNMLLMRRDRWRPVGMDVAAEAPPFIDVIKYRGTVVGATSPETLFFTSSGYGIDTGRDELPWVRNGRFCDPLDSSLGENDICSLHAYVAYVAANLDRLSAYYAPLEDPKINYTPHRRLLDAWLEQIEAYAAERGYSLRGESVPPVSVNFSQPFASVLTYNDTLYSLNGIITEQPREGAMPFDPKKQLLSPSARIARIHLGSAFSANPAMLNNLPVFVLPAMVKDKPGEYAFFALPLSAQGLDVFDRRVGSLLGYNADAGAVADRLSAVYDPDAEGPNLSVLLSITTADTAKTRTFNVKYEVGNAEGVRNHDLLLWPNFVSRQWNRYYLYSEMPHNVSTNTYAAFPFVGNPAENFRIITTRPGDDSDYTPLPLADGSNTVADGVELPGGDTLRVEMPVQATPAVAENPYKYEIYASNKPFKGVRLLSPTRAEGGFLLINYTTDPDRPSLPRDLLNSVRQLDPVTLGVDFGSTNTSVAFAPENESPRAFSFGRQRISLLGNELPSSRRLNVPNPNQVLFFQSHDKPLQSNAIKSVLTLHSPLRLHPLDNNQTDAMRAAEAVAGGFPCFRDNLPVKALENDNIFLHYPRIGQVEQIHNMKWSDRAIDKSHKTAFLRTLLLQVYAELFMKNYVPVSLVWSYPSAMDNKLLLSYQQIWNDLDALKVSPVVDEYGKPVNLKVSKYSLDISLCDGGGDPFAGDDNPFGSPSSVAAADPFGGDPFGNDPFGSGNPFGSDPFGTDPFAAPSPVLEAAAPVPECGKEAADLRPDDPDRVVDYKPRPIFPAGNELNSLTEATAVANFTSEEVGQQSNVLILCFDVGGSTTDISALWQLPRGLTMIKQNSLRFAAQLVSHATGLFPSFENVLREVCSQTGTRLLGLNDGDSRYSAATAPYYFEQVVDRFDDASLRLLYEKIGTECRQLMCVNLYVTGLLMFYAGQMAHKLIDDLMHSADKPVCPTVKISFAGKGSRLFQWLGIFPNNIDRNYYRTMFGAGYGVTRSQNGEAPDYRLEILLPNSDREKNIKYEVSKGLAKGNPKLYRPEGSNESEIVGESNFELVDREGNRYPISPINTLTPEMMRHIGRSLIPVSGGDCTRFKEFCGLFYRAANNLLNVNIPFDVFRQAFADMNIVQYVQTRPEYKAARRAAERGEPFDYVVPVIMLEGMKFYERYLLKSLS